jgi:uncharacterized membrane protein
VEAVLAGAGALIAAAAAAAALTVHSTRAALLAMAVVLVVSPLTLSPLPAPLPLAFWLTAALLATFLLLRSDRDPWGRLATLPLDGWPEAAFVIAMLALGWAVSPVAGAGRGAPSAMAAGFAVTTAAVPLLWLGRDQIRIAIGTVLVLDGAGLSAAGLAGTPGAAQVAALALAVLAAAAAARDVAAGHGPATGTVGGDRTSPDRPAHGDADSAPPAPGVHPQQAD